MQYFSIMLLLTVIFSFITLIKFNTAIKPNILFSILWLFGSYIVNSNFVGLHELSNNTNILMLITLSMFNIVYIIFSKYKIKKYHLQELKEIVNLNNHWGKILLANILLILITLPYFLKMVKIFLTESFYNVRIAAYVYNGAYEILMSKVIFILMFSLFNLLLILTALKIVLGDMDYNLFYLMVFDTIYFTIITGSRNFLAKFFVFLFLSVLFSNTHLIKKRFIMPRFIILGLIVLFILDRAIKARSLASLSPLENLIIYQFGGISYFYHITQFKDFLELNQVRLYGLGTFAWIISPFIYILSNLNIMPNITAEAIIGEVTSNGIYISDRFNFNALTTALYPMWRDFGTLGIFVGMSVFGFIVAFFENSFNKKRNLQTLLLFFSFYIAVFESTQLYDLLYLRFSMQIIWIFILFGSKRININLK
ncbi:O-antigen polymerase [Lactococcus cremoris]|uniref:O-antigen polymerase n=1 Tax=Lactococcus lactis subsp. cremoris TaxID=1359 RepID=UPI0024A66FF6|nr:O-antigen polymerase [Lactococcus cremoris]